MFICSCFAASLPCAGAETRDELVSSSDTAVAPAGSNKLFVEALGEYRHLNELIYRAAVYLPLDSHDLTGEGPMRLEMRIAAQEISARRFTRMWLDSISLNASREQRESLFNEIQAFSELFQDTLVAGDHVAFDYSADEQLTRFLLDGVELGAIAGDEFFRVLLSVRTGEHPKSTGLKTALFATAGNDIDTPAIDAFYALTYDDARRQQIAEVITREEQQALAARRAEQERIREQQRLEAEALAKAKALEEKKKAEEAERLRQQRLEQERLRREQEALARARHEEEQKALRQDYTRELVQWVSRHVVYPQTALRRGISGRVEIEVTSDRDGNLLAREIAESSGVQLLDEAADEIVMSAQPLPAIPDKLEGDNFTFLMPIAFILDD